MILRDRELESRDPVAPIRDSARSVGLPSWDFPEYLSRRFWINLVQEKIDALEQWALEANESVWGRIGISRDDALDIIHNLRNEITTIEEDWISSPMVYVDKITSMEPETGCEGDIIKITGIGLRTVPPPPPKPILLVSGSNSLDGDGPRFPFSSPEFITLTNKPGGLTPEEDIAGQLAGEFVDLWTDDEIRFMVTPNMERGPIGILDGLLYQNWRKLAARLTKEYLFKIYSGWVLPPPLENVASTSVNFFQGKKPYIVYFKINLNGSSKQQYRPGDTLAFEWTVEGAESVKLDCITTTNRIEQRETIDEETNSFGRHLLQLPLTKEDDFRFELICTNKCGERKRQIEVHVRVPTIGIWLYNLNNTFGDESSAAAAANLGYEIEYPERERFRTRLRNIAEKTAEMDNQRGRKASRGNLEDRLSWSDSAGDLFGFTEVYSSRHSTGIFGYDYYVAELVDCKWTIFHHEKKYAYQCFYRHWQEALNPDLLKPTPYNPYPSCVGSQFGEVSLLAHQDMFQGSEKITTVEKSLLGLITQEKEVLFLMEYVGEAGSGEKKVQILGTRLKIKGTDYVLPFYVIHTRPNTGHLKCCADIISVVNRSRRAGDLQPIVVGDFNFSRTRGLYNQAQNCKYYITPKPWTEMNKYFSCHTSSGMVDHIWIGRSKEYRDAPAFFVSNPEKAYDFGLADINLGVESGFTDHKGFYCGLRLTQTVTYTVWIKTGNESSAGTNADIYIRFKGSNGWSDDHLLDNPPPVNDFEKGHEDQFDNIIVSDVGSLSVIRIRFDGDDTPRKKDKWLLERVRIKRNDTGEIWECKTDDEHPLPVWFEMGSYATEEKRWGLRIIE